MTLPSKNLVLATLSSFLSYFVMSSMVSPLGVISASIAAQYDMSLTSATAQFSYMTTGVLLGSLLAIILTPLLGLRWAILGSCAGLMASLLALRMFDSASFLPFAFAAIGTCCGLLLATAATALTAVFEERHRPSALLATDSFYSMAGFVSTPIAGWVVAQSLHWTTAFAMVFPVTLVIFFIALITKYPPEMKQPAEEGQPKGRWPLPVFLVGMGLFVYLVCFTFVYAWTPAHAVAEFSIGSEQAGALVSRFFLGLLIGQLTMFFLALRIDVRILLGCVGVGAVLVSLRLWTSTSEADLALAMLGLGLVTGGFLKPLIAFGTQVVAYPSSRLVGFYMLSMAIGAALAPGLGARLVELSSMKTVLMLTSAGYGVTLGLIAITILLTRGQFSRRGKPALSEALHEI